MRCMTICTKWMRVKRDFLSDRTSHLLLLEHTSCPQIYIHLKNRSEAWRQEDVTGEECCWYTRCICLARVESWKGSHRDKSQVRDTSRGKQPKSKSNNISSFASEGEERKEWIVILQNLYVVNILCFLWFSCTRHSWTKSLFTMRRDDVETEN